MMTARNKSFCSDGQLMINISERGGQILSMLTPAAEFSGAQYQAAYHILFNRITDALEKQELSSIRAALIDAQRCAEEIFMSDDSP